MSAIAYCSIAVQSCVKPVIACGSFRGILACCSGGCCRTRLPQRHLCAVLQSSRLSVELHGLEDLSREEGVRVCSKKKSFNRSHRDCPQLLVGVQEHVQNETAQLVLLLIVCYLETKRLLVVMSPPPPPFFLLQCEYFKCLMSKAVSFIAKVLKQQQQKKHKTCQPSR